MCEYTGFVLRLIAVHVGIGSALCVRQSSGIRTSCWFWFYIHLVWDFQFVLGFAGFNWRQPVNPKVNVSVYVLYIYVIVNK